MIPILPPAPIPVSIEHISMTEKPHVNLVNFSEENPICLEEFYDYCANRLAAIPDQKKDKDDKPKTLILVNQPFSVENLENTESIPIPIEENFITPENINNSVQTNSQNLENQSVSVENSENTESIPIPIEKILLLLKI